MPERKSLTMEQFIERFPHLPLYAMRLLDYMERGKPRGFGMLLGVVADGNTEESLIDIIDQVLDMMDAADNHHMRLWERVQ
jgi:hypothetical protein